MFGLFKKKQQPAMSPGAVLGRFISGAADTLSVQLAFCSLDASRYQTFLHEKFARGYLTGFFDAAIQLSGIPIMDGEDYAQLIAAGHVRLMGGSRAKAVPFTVESLDLQGDPDFDLGRQHGGREYFDFMGEKVNPMGLARVYHASQAEG